jgi:hypothetical protein
MLKALVGLEDAKTISIQEMECIHFRCRTGNLLPASGEVFLFAAT